jgi:hypothetical protein
MNDPHASSPIPPSVPRTEDDPADLARPLLDQLLRSPGALLGRLDGPDAERCLRSLALVAFAGHAAYGLVVGSFSGGAQWWAAPLKIALGSFLCGAFCFPSLYIFISQSGAQTHARHVLGMLLGMLASTGVLLAGFAPVAWIFSQSSNSVALLAPLHYLVWIVSLLASARFFAAGLQRWHARRGALTLLWLGIFVVTCLQMTTTLRPILGTKERLFDPERKLFLLHWGQVIGAEVREAEGR